MEQGLTVASIIEAAGILRDVAVVTPVRTSRDLDRVISGKAFLKCETEQRTGAFKFRGAYHAVMQLAQRGGCRVVTTVSSGNHGQGLALAAKLWGLSAHVVMPQPVSAVKYHAVQHQGATVSLSETRALAEEEVRRLLQEKGTRCVHAFNDFDVMAGQGTIMLEFFAQVGRIEVLLAPIGGGGLLSGLCVAGHHLDPRLNIFACEPVGAWDVAESIRLNRVVPMPRPDTIADGLRTSVGSRTLPVLRAHLAGVLPVTEEEIAHAVRFAYERLNMLIEPSSAVALAPLLRSQPELRGHRIGVVLTGGNVDAEALRGPS